MATTSAGDQCALGPDGNLLDTSEIVWVNDPDDPMPVLCGRERAARANLRGLTVTSKIYCFFTFYQINLFGSGSNQH